MNAERYSAVTESTTSPESPDNKHLTPFVTEDRKGAEVCDQPQSRGDLVNALNETELRRIIDTIPALAWSSHPDGSVDFVNQRWTGYTGLSPEESYGGGWKTAIHPDDLPALAEKWEALRDVNTARECEVRLRRSDGVFRWFSLRREQLHDESRALVRWYGTAAAIDDHASATSFVCLMDRDGNQLLPIAGPHVPPEFARAITPWPIGPNRGSCGTAAFTKDRVIITDISDDPRWPDDARGLALNHGVCAAWSEPLISTGGEVLGTFCISYSEPRTPSGRDLELVESAGHIARIAIERQRWHEALRTALDEIKSSEAKLRQVIDTIPTLAWCNLPDGPNEFLNKRWHDYTGLSPEESHGWGWQAAFHPEDLPRLMDKWL